MPTEDFIIWNVLSSICLSRFTVHLSPSSASLILCLWKLISWTISKGSYALWLPVGFGQWGALVENGREGNEGGTKRQVFYSFDSLLGRSPRVGCVLLPRAKSTGFSPTEIP